MSESIPPEPSSEPSPGPIVCVPMKLDAFRLNTKAFNNPFRLAPFHQPEYTNLRLSDDFRTFMQHDVLPPVDLHNSGLGHPYNDRVTDLTTGSVLPSRQGIYLHWMIPRFYRNSLVISQSDDADNVRKKLGFKPPYPDDPYTPIYHTLPNRWIVVRHITDSYGTQLPEFEAFVVESDRVRRLGDLDSKVDIQVDMSPFIHVTSEETSRQGEYFIGFKASAKEWKEEVKDRVTLTIGNASNPLFADYQPHNSNVFSIVDNFAYGGRNGAPINYAKQCKANYYVIGWHNKEEDDPFHNGDADLKTCLMTLVKDEPGSIAKDSRLILHGAMYDVNWYIDQKPQYGPNAEVNGFYEGFRDKKNYSPIAVGGSPLDALIAVAHAQKYKVKENDVWSAFAQDLLALQALVDQLEKDPDSHLQSVDSLHTSCFIPSDGGLRWHISGKTDEKESVVPSKAELDELDKVNGYQMFVDLCVREMKSVQWLIWAEWWKWVIRGPEREKDKEVVVKRIRESVDAYRALEGEVQAMNEEIAKKTKKYPKWESVPKPRYYIARDPAILFCGMKNPWPVDYTGPLAVRFGSQLKDPATEDPDDPDGLDVFIKSRDNFVKRLPNQLRSTGTSLLSEFYNLHHPPSGTWQNPTPLYHDDPSKDKKLGMRDNWNSTQPWFPLFVEWEIEYLHIHKDLWEPVDPGVYGSPMLRSAITGAQVLDENGRQRLIHFDKIQVVSGRELIVPQTTMMIKNALDQLLKVKSSHPELLKKMEALLHEIPFLNITLSGVRDQLATRRRGTHISPTSVGGLPLREAIKASEGVIDEDTLKLIRDTTVTPFGDFPGYGTVDSPFKPVTHGLFRFTKLNVIDKFGQAVCAIDPERGLDPDDNISKLFPYISEIYSPPDIPDDSISLSSKKPWQPGETIHLAPSINQYSRLNGHFVKRDEKGTYWVPVTEYDNPIWGWIVVNYMDRGLQVFLPNGTFYREIRLGNGVSVSEAWLPFKPPKDPSKLPPQLLRFIDKFVKNPKHLQDFFDAITKALECDAFKHADDLYAGYLPSITGRPFALVNTGWSLELSHPFYVNQSTLSPGHTEPGLEEYDFPIKLGDLARTFDGVLGYFPQDYPPDAEYKFDEFYTYFTEEEDPSKLTKPIKPQNYPKLTPWYDSAYDIGTKEVESPATIVDNYNQKLKVFTMLIEPFTAIHGYSSCQPIKELRLPYWPLEQSLSRITAFFHMGPVVMPLDAPAFDPKRQFDQDLTKIEELLEGVSSGFPVPSVTVADWAWLQPYSQNSNEEPIVFNPFPVTKFDPVPEFNEAPYTAVEGFLYQKKPITEPPQPSK